MNITAAQTNAVTGIATRRLRGASLALSLASALFLAVPALLSSALVGCIASPAEVEELENGHASASNSREAVDDETAGAVSAPVTATGSEIPTGGAGGGGPTGKPQPSPWRPSNPPKPGQGNTVTAPGTIQAPQPSPWSGQGPQPGSNGPTAEVYSTAQQQ